jgi:hypothetical protein
VATCESARIIIFANLRVIGAKKLKCAESQIRSTHKWKSGTRYGGGIMSLRPLGPSSTMAKAPLPPAPVLVLLPSNHAIVLTANNDIALCILQGVMLTRAHILPIGKWANHECLLFDPEPPAPSPFHRLFSFLADSQHYKKRGTKDTMQGNQATDKTPRRGGQRTQYKVIG